MCECCLLRCENCGIELNEYDYVFTGKVYLCKKCNDLLEINKIHKTY